MRHIKRPLAPARRLARPELITSLAERMRRGSELNEVLTPAWGRIVMEIARGASATTGLAVRSLETLAAKAGLRERQTRTVLRRMEAAGLIHAEGGGGRFADGTGRASSYGLVATRQSGATLSGSKPLPALRKERQPGTQPGVTRQSVGPLKKQGNHPPTRHSGREIAALQGTNIESLLGVSGDSDVAPKTNQGLATRGAFGATSDQELAARRRLFGGREYELEKLNATLARLPGSERPVAEAIEPNPVPEVEAGDRQQEVDPELTTAAAAAATLPPVLVRGRPVPRRLASPDQLELGLQRGSGPVPFWRRSANYELLSQQRVAQLAAERVGKVREVYDERLAGEVALKFPELMPRPKFALKRFPRRPARYVCRCREGRGRAARSRTIHLGMVAKVSLSEAASRFWRVVVELQNTGKVTGRWRELPDAVGSRTHQGVAGDGAAG